ncbi:hypothetical protein CMUS01_05299 [Colletotrichum musicola]|uniref:Uncharacterized protein n=1 Tax=Colletotrichum musicola TaxID=2175873 RepID=A0A8H6KT44_9PEZI|nr:hypothetical protein CMUS01_05299 [Colletotrichum musicola]
MFQQAGPGLGLWGWGSEERGRTHPPRGGLHETLRIWADAIRTESEIPRRGTARILPEFLAFLSSSRMKAERRSQRSASTLERQKKNNKREKGVTWRRAAESVSRKSVEGEGRQGPRPGIKGRGMRSWDAVVGIAASGLHARRFEMGRTS